MRSSFKMGKIMALFDDGNYPTEEKFDDEKEN